MRYIRRDDYPDFSKLAWMARRRGPRGTHALQVLQDALMIHYGRQFERIMRIAEDLKQQKGHDVLVLFLPEWERADRRGERRSHFHQVAGPFSITAETKSPVSYRHSVFVYSTRGGLHPRRYLRRRRRFEPRTQEGIPPRWED